jgi:hypothetical protein
MTAGPVQLLVIYQEQAHVPEELVAHLDRLREGGDVQVVDAIAVHKGAEDQLRTETLSRLGPDRTAEFEGTLSALVGLGFDGGTGMLAGDHPETLCPRAFSDEDLFSLLDRLPEGSAALLVLVEHRWAGSLRQTIAGAGGHRVSDGFLSPLDLVAIGLADTDEAYRLNGRASTAAYLIP